MLIVCHTEADSHMYDEETPSCRRESVIREINMKVFAFITLAVDDQISCSFVISH